jgi:hypothetical protein
MRMLLHLTHGGPRRRRLMRKARGLARAAPLPHVTLRAPWLLRLAGFTVGDAGERIYVARNDFPRDVMAPPEGARAIATGAPVRQVRMSLLSWAWVLLWRLVGRL